MARNKELITANYSARTRRKVDRDRSRQDYCRDEGDAWIEGHDGEMGADARDAGFSCEEHAVVL